MESKTAGHKNLVSEAEKSSSQTLKVAVRSQGHISPNHSDEESSMLRQIQTITK